MILGEKEIKLYENEKAKMTLQSTQGQTLKMYYTYSQWSNQSTTNFEVSVDLFWFAMVCHCLTLKDLNDTVYQTNTMIHN